MNIEREQKSEHDLPMFSRPNYKEGKTEMRGLAPVELVQALDALALSMDMNRNEYINVVLERHVRWELHKHSVTANMLRDNPLMAEPDRRNR
jgi:hypothetical protein